MNHNRHFVDNCCDSNEELEPLYCKTNDIFEKQHVSSGREGEARCGAAASVGGLEVCVVGKLGRASLASVIGKSAS